MAYMHFNNAPPILYADYVEPRRRYSIETDSVFFFIEEVIDYALSEHNLPQWIPPVNLDFAFLMNETRYFNQNFAATVIRDDIEEGAKQLAYRNGFNENVWLEFINHEEARRYLERHISFIFSVENPCLFGIFSFACYASRIALESYCHHLVNDVVWAFHAVLCKILPNEPYFVINVYNNEHIDNQSHDMDEGIIDDDTSLSLRFVDEILLFVVELIDYSLRDVELYHWIPCIDLEILRGLEMSYFTENLGKAITNDIMEHDAVHFARGWSFNEERWLKIYEPSEARAFQEYFLQKLFNTDNAFLMFSFASYCSKLALGSDRNSLVNEVVSALVDILRAHFPHWEHYRNFDYLARQFDNFLRHTNDADEGIGSEAN